VQQAARARATSLLLDSAVTASKEHLLERFYRRVAHGAVALVIAEVLYVDRTGVAQTRVLARPQANGARFVQAHDALVVSFRVGEKAPLAGV
jgi:hypothetical protein